jgi:hypothetical protein
MTREPRHNCPGGCDRTVPRHLLACSPCWWRMPEEMRKEINIAYARRAHDPAGHRRVIVEAYQWFRANPREVSR